MNTMSIMNIITLTKFEEPDGILVPFDIDKVPFDVKRIFYIYNVPKGECRGFHAHYETQQLLICIKGEIEVSLFDGEKIDIHILKEGQTILIPNMMWDYQRFLTGNDILLVLCSTKYNRKDYIENLEKFKEIIHGKRA